MNKSSRARSWRLFRLIKRLESWVQCWPLKARRETIFILPTREGMAFLGLVMIILISASHYNNNLVFLLGFAMFSLFITSMVQTHNNVRSLALDSVQVPDSVASEPTRVIVFLRNKGSQSRIALNVRGRRRADLVGQPGTLEILRSHQAARIEFDVKSPGRGKHSLRFIVIESRFPIGLFRAWRVLPVDVVYYVAPAPMGPYTLEQVRNQGHPSGEGHHQVATAGGEDFEEHRIFQPGESYHHVDWKIFARRGVLMKKRFASPGRQHFRLSFQALTHLPLEGRLSQLAKWINEADSRGVSYELQMPSGGAGERRALAQGRHQYRQACLRDLAVFAMPADPMAMKESA